MFVEEDVVEEDVSVQEPEGDEAVNEPEPEEIPSELEGIDDEDIARSIMEEAKQDAGKEEPVAEESDPPAEEEQAVEQEEESAVSPIPYKRFKQVLDKGKAKDEEIAKLKEEIENLKRNPPPQQPVQNVQPVSQQTPPPPMRQDDFLFTQENMNLINQAIQNEAVRMSQLTREDLENLDYMEDSDPRKQRWQYAQEMARGVVFDSIRQAQEQKQAQANRFMEMQQRSIFDFNQFANEQKEDPEFNNIVEFGSQKLFPSLPSETDKAVIASAYARVERNAASPEDIYIIKNFFTMAKEAYLNQKQNSEKAKPQKSKAEQAKTFPRSGQISGASDSGGVTVASLEKMLNEMPFSKIDPKYQKMLLGG